MKGYICDICEKFVDNPFKVRMREFVMTVDWGDGIATPSKIRHKVHMCGDCYTKFVNYIKYKSLKEKVDEQTKQSMPKLPCSGCTGKEKCDPDCSGCSGCGGEACVDYGKETCSIYIKKGENR